MGGLLENNKSIVKDAKGKLTMPPAVTCVLDVASESRAGMDGMRSVVLVLVDVEVEGPCPCVGRRSDSFLGLKSLFFPVRFISLIR